MRPGFIYPRPITGREIQVGRAHTSCAGEGGATSTQQSNDIFIKLIHIANLLGVQYFGDMTLLAECRDNATQ